MRVPALLQINDFRSEIGQFPSSHGILIHGLNGPGEEFVNQMRLYKGVMIRLLSGPTGATNGFEGVYTPESREGPENGNTELVAHVFATKEGAEGTLMVVSVLKCERKSGK